MFFIFLSLISSKVIQVSESTFSKHSGSTPICLVLFTSNKCVQCKRITSILDEVSTKYSGAVTCLSINIRSTKGVAKRFNTEFVSPSIGIFRMGNLRGFYNGAWTSNGISELCEKILNADVKYIQTDFELYEFQNQNIPALVVKNKSVYENAGELLDNFGGLMNIGIIDNENLMKKLKFLIKIL